MNCVRISCLTFAISIVCTPLLAGDDPQPFSEQQLNFFESKIRPVLVTHCYECHSSGAKLVQGGLRLDSREAVIRGGESGKVVILGKPGESPLIKGLKYDGLEMPPKGKLPDSVIQDFETWIQMGLPDPRKGDSPPEIRTINLEEGRKHWAFQPVTDPPVPVVKDETWLSDPVDRFVLSKLEHNSLRPTSDADAYTWLRRVTFDLTGLPPTVGDIDQFVCDASPQARDKVVDRLLASRAFGERWARHWLDLTGYADQVGTSNEVFAEHTWRYRDYLINAFNTDKPFDRFLIEQIAGDLLPAATPEQRSEQLVATGFLLVGDVEIVNPDKLKMETDHVDIQLSKIGTVFMGMTLGCVRCHDHKFDPIELTDYYGMAGTLRSTVSTRKIENGIWSGLNVVELPETAEQIAKRQMLTTAHQQRIDQLNAEAKRLNDEKNAIAADLEKPDADKEALTKRRDQIQGRLQQIPGELQHAQFFAPSVPKAFAVQDSVNTTDMRVCIRGNPYAPGKTIPRGVMQVALTGTAPTMPKHQSGRLQLAEWLADPKHPLTARVTVNRIWQKLFGEGLVRSVDYFGTRGERPTHPELLDHLASRFMRDGWSQKKLIRSLVLCRVYGLSSGQDPVASKVDPDNRLLWRMNSQRLDAEALRDAMLVASGEMVACDGGPSLPLEYIENSGNLAPKSVNPPSFSLRRFRPEQEFVRTVYLPIVRSSQKGSAALRDVFDFTQPAQIAGRRAQTVVAPQALYLLNNDWPRRRATALATAIQAAATSQSDRLSDLWLRTLNRPMTTPETEEATAFLNSIASPSDAWIELCHALLSCNEFIHRL